MATIPVVNTQDKRIGVTTSIIALVLLFVLLWFLKYEKADPPPEDIPIKMAEPLDVREIEHIVVETGGGGGGKPSEANENHPQQTEQVLTQESSDTQTNSGQANTSNTHDSDAPPAGDGTEDYFSGGTGGGEGGGDGPGFGPDGGEGTGGNGNGSGGAGRSVVKDVNLSNFQYDKKVFFKFKVVVNSNGDIVNAYNIKGATTTTDQILINKMLVAVKKQVKFSKDPGAGLVTKHYSFTLQPT
jgi:hypothetical protein